VALVVVLTRRAKGLNALDSFGMVVEPIFVLCFVAVLAWDLIKRLLLVS
jgi:hypothetical protein